ncbi:hypothetical protein LOTGIDRAFT_229805 [Lottia gigantea]|uniref:Uncharacterized protein n=1 Tax=Lottia gigantea TaxID=225164 RepID=V3ZF87_LOTGI|nr:hypothetical protein LOTGIDRAFT_229805 [Lottia gigantea]ESO82782.1 hypothetical protein LOTGIDRAFT_229805 [Lottia gigantea]
MFEDISFRDMEGLNEDDKEVIAYAQSTKGHSVLRKYAYSSPPSQRRYGYGLDYSSVSPVRSRYYSGEEDYLNSAVQRATSIGSDALYDTYDTANMSRNRDYDLISATNSAIQPPSPFSAVKARLNRISSNLPHRRFPSQHFTSRSDISPIRDLDTSDTTSLVASPSPRPSAVHIPHTPHSTYRHSPLPDSTSDKLYRDSDTSHLVASPAPQPAILPHRLHSLSHRAGLSTPITAGSTWNDFNLPVPTQASAFSERPILDDPNLANLPEQRSSTLVHGYLSPSLVAKYSGSPIISPIGSGTQTPIRSSYLTRSKYADIPSLAQSIDDTGLEYGPDTKYTGQRHRVLGTKRYTGNYYDRLCKKRLGREKRSKYWPYYDVESIGQSDDSDILSDEEYGTSGYTPVSYRDTEDYTTDNYVPFKPRYDTLTSPGLLEMSPYNESALKPDLSYLSSSNLLPRYKPSTSTDVSKYNEHDSVISSLVAKSVQKAKEHLKGVNWGKYENASLVLSVEGDVVHPNNGERYGFRYYPEPISVHGKADVTERLAGVAPKELSSGDQVFFNYVSKMRDFRDGVRNRLGDVDTYSYKPRYDSNLSKTILTRLPPLQSGHPSYIPQTTFKKRLEGGLSHQVDVFSLPMSDQALPSSLQLSTKPKSNEKHDGYSREGPVTVLDRILIKVNTETHSSPRAAVASLRARTRPQTQPLSARRVSPVRQVYQQVEFVRASSAPPLGQPVVVFAQPRQSWARRSPIFVRNRSPSVERSRSVDREYGAFEYLHRHPTAPTAIREALDSSRRPTKDDRTNYLVAKYERSIRNAQRAMSPSHVYDYDVAPTRSRGYYISPANTRHYRYYPRRYRMLDYYTSPLTAHRHNNRFWRFLGDTSEKSPVPYYELMYNPRYQNEVNRLLESLERPRTRKRKQRSLYAAIVASKLEDEPGTRRRRTPRSKYAADKYRATHKVGENPLYYSPDPHTAGLTASRGTVQRVTERKAVRDSEGNFTKPKNILSWQYRLDSRIPPEEVLYRPTTFNRMRERLHEAQDKMDRHRQLLDRYIPEEGTSESIESRVNRKLNELEQRDSSGGSKASVGSYTPFDYYGPSGPPVSETRRRIRRVLNGTRR